MFRLECNCSYRPPRFIFRYITAFIAIDSTDSSLFPLPYFPFPVSLILSSLKSSAVTAPNVPRLYLWRTHIYSSPNADFMLPFDIFLPFSPISYSRLFCFVSFLHPYTYFFIQALSLFNEIFAIDFQFVSRTLQVFVVMLGI